MDPRRDDPVRSPEASTHTSQLPEGVVTFLLTDIEGSTPLWETHTAAMSAALARHEALVTEVVASHGVGSSSPVARAIRPFPCSFGPLMPVAYYLGLLASTMSRWADAIYHLETAMDLSTRIGAPAFLANSRPQYARALRGHGQLVDDKAPEDHLAQAHASAGILGIRLHLDDCYGRA